MAENKKPIFIVATANNTDFLPSYLIWKGRLDKVFLVDFPNQEILTEIFSIRFNKRNIDLSPIDLTKLMQRSLGFPGAEVEQVVLSALYQAMALKQEVETKHLLPANSQY